MVAQVTTSVGGTGDLRHSPPRCGRAARGPGADDGATATAAVDRLLPGRLRLLQRLQRLTGDPVLRARLLRTPRGWPGLRGRAPAPAATALLAPRELDVPRLVAVGASNLEIAARLGPSPETVEAHLRSAVRRLGVHDRTAAVHAARVAGVP